MSSFVELIAEIVQIKDKKCFKKQSTVILIGFQVMLIHLIIKAIAGIAVISSWRFDGFVLVLKCLTLLDIGWSQQIAIVIDGTWLCNSPFHHFRAEVITVAQVGESDDVIFSLAVADQRYAWNYFNTKALCEEWTLLGVNFAEFRFDVLCSENSQMLINNFTPFGSVAVEVTNNVLWLLWHFKKFLFINQFRIFAVSLKWKNKNNSDCSSHCFLVLLTCCFHFTIFSWRCFISFKRFSRIDSRSSVPRLSNRSISLSSCASNCLAAEKRIWSIFLWLKRDLWKTWKLRCFKMT